MCMQKNTNHMIDELLLLVEAHEEKTRPSIIFKVSAHTHTHRKRQIIRTKNERQRGLSGKKKNREKKTMEKKERMT